ncbi:MAG: Mov34/MPN/PAD-1 family protein, partial [Promethearchaeota archaeon]
MSEQVDPWAHEGVVKIKPKAYIKMVKHVLSYGNEALDQSVEVMGICMGKEKGNDIIVYDAVPVSHGSSIEVGFTPSDYAAFAKIDEEYANSGLYAVGWYHSHPGLKAFFSQTDIKNHLFYQKEQTPKGFGIVFDHEYFNEKEGPLKMGFKCFRLNDYRKGTASDFHECKAIVLPPEDLDVYQEVIDIIESAQSKKSFIKEIGGLDVDDSVWSFPEESETKEGGAAEGKGEGLAEEEEKKKSELEQLKDAAADSMEAFTKEFTQKFLERFDEFKKDTAKATQKGATVMVDIIATMKENVEKGVARIKKYLNDIANKEIANVQKSIEESFERLDKDRGEFNKNFKEFTENISEQIGNILKEALSQKLDDIIALIKKSAESAVSIGEKSNSIQINVQAQEDIIRKLKESIETETNKIENTVKNIKSK